MQKFIVKYGLAAHLAILAVAPLFLFSLCGTAAISKVLLWLSIPAAVWIFVEPSLRGGERLHMARRRVAQSVYRDPLVWGMLAVVIFAGLRDINSGVALAYDVESAKWCIASPTYSLLPGCAGDSGHVLFAGAVALLVVMTGCRHSLGQSARMAFLHLTAFLSGGLAFFALYQVHRGSPTVLSALSFEGGLYSYVGWAFGFQLLAGLVALAAAFERSWIVFSFLSIVSIGGAAAGLYVFAPPYVSAIMGTLAVLLLVYAIVYIQLTMRAMGGVKLLVLVGLALALCGFAVYELVPREILSARNVAFVSSFDMLKHGRAGAAFLSLFPSRYWDVRPALSSIAVNSWTSHLWIGSGLQSFPLTFRFLAQAGDWALLPRGADAAPYGWMVMLVERGVVGVAFFVLPLAFLGFTYVRRLVAWFRVLALPRPGFLLGPFALAAFLLSGFLDCSLARVDVLLAVCSMVAISALAFPTKKR